MSIPLSARGYAALLCLLALLAGPARDASAQTRGAWGAELYAGRGTDDLGFEGLVAGVRVAGGVRHADARLLLAGTILKAVPFGAGVCAMRASNGVTEEVSCESRALGLTPTAEYSFHGGGTFHGVASLRIGGMWHRGRSGLTWGGGIGLEGRAVPWRLAVSFDDSAVAKLRTVTLAIALIG